MAKVDKNHELIQKTNRRMAKMYDALRRPDDPCDVEEFVIKLEELER